MSEQKTETAVEKAIREANEKAASAAPAIETQAVQTTGGAVVHQALTPQVATLDTLTQAGMNVDDWLKVNGHGMQIGSKSNLVKTFKAKIRLQDIKAFYGVRYGDPAVYLKSFDRVSCVQGGTWPEAISKAQRADAKCQGEYVGADMIITVAEDIKDGDVLLIEAGKRLGHSTSPTGSKPVAAFVRETKDNKKLDEDVWMLIEIKHVQRTKPNIQPWGVLELTLIEILEPQE